MTEAEIEVLRRKVERWEAGGEFSKAATDAVTAATWAASVAFCRVLYEYGLKHGPDFIAYLLRLPDMAPGVPVVVWKWKGTGNPEIDGQPGAGVLAQDIEAVRPDLVLTGPGGVKTVNYVALLAGAGRPTQPHVPPPLEKKPL